MKKFQSYAPEQARETRDLVDSLNRMIERGEPDSEVVHTALTGLLGAVAQLEADLRRRIEADEAADGQ
ncbi:hypothetical protein ACXYTP_25410 [Tsukamurella ocularis]